MRGFFDFGIFSELSIASKSRKGFGVGVDSLSVSASRSAVCCSSVLEYCLWLKPGSVGVKILTF